VGDMGKGKDDMAKRASAASNQHTMTPRTQTGRRSGMGRFLRIVFLIGGLLLVRRYGEEWLRSALLYLSRASWARRMVTGFDPAWAMASRFVAGETIDEAISVAKQLNDDGLLVTLDYLGESVSEAAEAAAARDQILTLLDGIHSAKVNANVSVKLSQLGLKLDENMALANLRTLLDRAGRRGNRVRVDMEESEVVDITLDIYRTLRDQEGFDNVGVVIQSYLYRSDDDVRQLVQEGAWVRLVKGAYKEPATVAYPHKADTDAAYMRQVEMMLSEEARRNGVYLAVATHDDRIIQQIVDFARRNQLSADAFEFQMLYGVRREKQRELVADGWRVRVYVPYGTAWYPYFMRRLAERPANLWFFISNFFRA
jgi:proline dehydrogenase